MGTHIENILLNMYLYFAPYFSGRNTYEQARISLGLNHIFSYLVWKENSLFISCLQSYFQHIMLENKIILSRLCEYFGNNAPKVVNLVRL